MLVASWSEGGCCRLWYVGDVVLGVCWDELSWACTLVLDNYRCGCCWRLHDVEGLLGTCWGCLFLFFFLGLVLVEGVWWGFCLVFKLIFIFKLCRASPMMLVASVVSLGAFCFSVRFFILGIRPEVLFTGHVRDCMFSSMVLELVVISFSFLLRPRRLLSTRTDGYELSLALKDSACLGLIFFPWFDC